jgi:hypothetical protein
MLSVIRSRIRLHLVLVCFFSLPDIARRTTLAADKTAQNYQCIHIQMVIELRIICNRHEEYSDLTLCPKVYCMASETVSQQQKGVKWNYSCSVQGTGVCYRWYCVLERYYSTNIRYLMLPKVLCEGGVNVPNDNINQVAWYPHLPCFSCCLL